MNIDKLLPNHKTDALVAEKLGYIVSQWSIHPWEGNENAKIFRPGIGFTGSYGDEILLPDGEGDCPGFEMLENGQWHRIPEYSKSILSAWNAIEIFSKRYLWFQIGIEHLPNGEDTCGWEVVLYNDPNMKDRIYANASDAPLAICQALLLTTVNEQ